MSVDAVLFAKHLAPVCAFYEQVVGFAKARVEDDSVALETAGFRLTIVRIPQRIAASIKIAAPSIRREETPIKLSFLVDCLQVARDRAAQCGGTVDPAEREWLFESHKHCDGHDPEGNVVQLRQRV